MGRSCQRKKRSAPQRPVAIAVNIDQVTPACPGGARAGLDGMIFLALQQVDLFVRDMRAGIVVPSAVDDERTAVLRYLAYGSVLVDVCLADIAISAVHENDLAVIMKQRMLVEYAAKASYFSNHADYALYEMTIGEISDVLKKHRIAESDPTTIAEGERALDDLRLRFSHVAHITKRSFFEIMKELASGDEYAWLYGSPSALIHGDPEGMRQVFKIDEHGNQRVVINLDDSYLNASMVDAGGNALLFCRAFIEAYHQGDAAFEKRLQELELTFWNLILKHPLGRAESVLDAIRAELRASHEP